MRETKEEELLRILEKTIELWEKNLHGQKRCPFCVAYVTCGRCPIRRRFGSCTYSKFNPYAIHGSYSRESYLMEKQREAVLKAGRKWMTQILAKQAQEALEGGKK